MADETVCPPFGAGSVDFNAVHDAAKKGKDLSKAIEVATSRADPPAEAPSPALEPTPAAPEAAG